MITLTFENNLMSSWSPITREQARYQCTQVDKVLQPSIGPSLAEWNLNWLFDYAALSQIDGTVEGITRYFKETNATIQGALHVDVADNLYGLNELAETLGPVEFLDTFLRKPYQHTSLYKMAGEAVFKAARVNAEKLALTMRDKAEGAAEVAADVIQKAKVIAFPRR